MLSYPRPTVVAEFRIFGLIIDDGCQRYSKRRIPVVDSQRNYAGRIERIFMPSDCDLVDRSAVAASA